MAWRSARVAAFLLALILTARPAFAHDAFGTMGPFWSGALHVAVSALALATLIGVGAALAPLAKPFVFPVLMVAVAASALATSAGAVLGDFGAAGAIAVGMTAAFVRNLNIVAAIALALVAGSGAGVAAEVDTPSVAAAAGAAFAGFLIAGSSYGAFTRLNAVLPMARRVVGAWVAAIGILIAALTLVRSSFW